MRHVVYKNILDTTSAELGDDMIMGVCNLHVLVDALLRAKMYNI